MIYCITQIYDKIGEQKIIHLLLLILSNLIWMYEIKSIKFHPFKQIPTSAGEIGYLHRRTTGTR